MKNTLHYIKEFFKQLLIPIGVLLAQYAGAQTTISGRVLDEKEFLKKLEARQVN